MGYEDTLTGGPPAQDEVGQTPEQREALTDFLTRFRGWCAVGEDRDHNIVVQTGEGNRTITPAGTVIYDEERIT
jgi:hypothetical protein